MIELDPRKERNRDKTKKQNETETGPEEMRSKVSQNLSANVMIFIIIIIYLFFSRGECRINGMMMLKEEENVVWGRLIIEQVVVSQFISRWKAFRAKLDILQLCIIQPGGDRYPVRKPCQVRNDPKSSVLKS